MAVGFLFPQRFPALAGAVADGLQHRKSLPGGCGLSHQGYRVLSFLALGVLLLTVSFAYQKDWLALRESRQ